MDECANAWPYRQIVEDAPDAIIFSDQDGLIRIWNQGAKRIFGYEPLEVVGKSLDVIIPEKLQARHREGYRKVMETGLSRYGQELLAVPAVRKDGTRISIEFSVMLVRSASGEVSGIAAIIRDSTTRWMKEKGLKDRLAALERSV